MLAPLAYNPISTQIYAPFASFSSSVFSNPTCCNPVIPLSIIYMVTANFAYLSRRSHLRNMPKRKLLKIRTTREPDTSLRLYLITLFTWQCFVAIFPFVESCVRYLFSHVSFFYSYPNAHGVGVILEPLEAQSLSISQRTKMQIRFDWHRFTVNIGQVGRDGYRHPPARELNLPHLDIPRKKMKHWPWRRRYSVVK